MSQSRSESVISCVGLALLLLTDNSFPITVSERMPRGYFIRTIVIAHCLLRMVFLLAFTCTDRGIYNVVQRPLIGRLVLDLLLCNPVILMLLTLCRLICTTLRERRMPSLEISNCNWLQNDLHFIRNLIDNLLNFFPGCVYVMMLIVSQSIWTRPPISGRMQTLSANLTLQQYIAKCY